MRHIFSMIWLYGDYQGLAGETPSHKTLKSFYIVSKPKYDQYQKGLSSMVYKLLDKKLKGSDGSGFNEVNLCQIQN